MSFASIIGGIVFGAVGFVAFVYGKRQAEFRTMGIGVVLMVFPYFFANTIIMYVIGTALTVALFLFHG
jgi:hypothetical protein